MKKCAFLSVRVAIVVDVGIANNQNIFRRGCARITFAEKRRILEDMNSGTKGKTEVNEALGVGCSALATLFKMVGRSANAQAPGISIPDGNGYVAQLIRLHSSTKFRGGHATRTLIAISG